MSSIPPQRAPAHRATFKLADLCVFGFDRHETTILASSVLIDEISRCKPEHQNRLFSLVHERRLQALPLERLKFR